MNETQKPTSSNDHHHHPTPVLQDDELVRASNLESSTGNDDDDYAITGRFLRGIMKYTNLDFLYIFHDQLDPIRLKASLSQVLNHYPTLTGRIDTKSSSRIHLNNQGAAFRVQTTTKNIRELYTKGGRQQQHKQHKQQQQQHEQEQQEQEPPIGLYCYIPVSGEQVKGTAPLLTVTVTQFQKNRGSTLGVVMNHLVADAWTFAMFMKDWSEIYNTGTLSEPVVSHIPDIVVDKFETQEEADQAASELGNERSPWIMQVLLRFGVERVIPLMMKGKDHRLGQSPNRLILHYSKEQLTTIKSKAEEKASTWISTNEALMAHVWKLLLDAAQWKPSSANNSFLGASLSVNLRRKLPGVSHRVAGNVVTSPAFAMDMSNYYNDDDERTTTTMEEKEDTTDSSSFEKQLHDGLRQTIQYENLVKHLKIQNRTFVIDHDQHHHDRDCCRFVNYQHKLAGDLNFGGKSGCLQWNSQATNPYFEIEFGKGNKPVRGIPWDWEQQITVLPRVDENGVDVYITKSGRGPVSWKDTTSSKTWSKTCNVLRTVMGVSGGMSLLQCYYYKNRYSYYKSTPLWFWLAAATTASVCIGSGMLWVKIWALAQQDVERSKQEFFDHVRTNAHR